MFFDVFGGGGCVSLAKDPCRLEVFNDLDGEVYHFFRTLQDPEQAQELFRLAYLTEYGRRVYEEIRDRKPPFDGPPASDAERAYRFFVVNRMSYGGYSAGSAYNKSTRRPAWSYSVTIKRKDVAASVAVWLKGVESLMPVFARLQNTQIENLDFRDLCRRYGDMNPEQHAQSLWYFDPPYIQDTRVRGGYRHELSDEDHQDLVEILLGLQGMAILSGYAHPLYAALEAKGWERVEVESRVYCSGKGAKKNLRTECIWLSPAAQSRYTLFGRLREEANDEAA